MAKFGKWIGAGIGFVMGGPLGALFGLFLGSAFDSATIVSDTSAPSQSGRGDFMFSLTVLATAIMKADGCMTRSELTYVKNFLLQNFGEEATREGLSMINKLRSQDIPVMQVCTQIRYNMNPTLRTHLLYFLFGIAQADVNISTQE
ncbi:MAG: TerB family tellurite resistance protein, partial [Odoribacter sp.]|nr:TerB family tellurite resistance protein [Odoribacter sp.]